MGKIICLMGKSSTGKDTLFQHLLADEELGLKRIVPYTTRPIRDGERDGVEYFFTDEAGFKRFQERNKIIEAREYHTFYGLWRYFTADDGQIESGQDYMMIGTLEAYRYLQEYFGTDKIVPVMIELDDGIRLQRALDRERQQEIPRYEEMCRRFLTDSADFSEEKIAEAGICRRFVNDNLERCLGEIRAYLSGSLQRFPGLQSTQPESKR